LLYGFDRILGDRDEDRQAPAAIDAHVNLGAGMTTILITGAWFAFLYWLARRARENAAERRASGLSRDPLYWIGCSMSVCVLVLAMYIAHEHIGFTDGGRWFYVAALALTIAALLVRRTLKWRYPY
jgi:hypothetical protein